VIALRDVLPYYDWSHLAEDPLLKERVSSVRKKWPGGNGAAGSAGIGG